MSITTNPIPISVPPTSRVITHAVPPDPSLSGPAPAHPAPVDHRPSWAAAFERRLRRAVGDLGVTVPQDWISVAADGSASFATLDRTAADRLVRTIEDVTGRVRAKRRPRRIPGQLALFEPPATHLEAA